MASFHIFKTAPYRQAQGKQALTRFIQGMMKLSSLNYFHPFKRGDELLNARL
jgi:hypothetical protein